MYCTRRFCWILLLVCLKTHSALASIAGCSLALVTPARMQATTIDLAFTVETSGGSFEFLDAFSVTLPAEWTVTRIRPTAKASGCVGGTTVVQSGQEVTWRSDLPLPTGCGPWVNLDGVSHVFTLEVTIPSCSGAPWTVAWQLLGDGREAAPHSMHGTWEITECFRASLSRGSYTLHDLAYPASAGSALLGINDQGQVVGIHHRAGSAERRGFFWDGAFHDIAYPGFADATIPMDVNGNGLITGVFIEPVDVHHGFLFEDGTYSAVHYGGAGSTRLNHTNNHGDVSGYYTVLGRSTAFIYTAGHDFQTYAYPGATSTIGMGINDDRGLCGVYQHETPRGYTGHDRTDVEPVSVPGALGTFASGINNRGWVVGYFMDVDHNVHGFIYKGDGRYELIDYPGAEATQVYDINNRNEFVGYYTDREGASHGFIGRPFSWSIFRPALDRPNQ